MTAFNMYHVLKMLGKIIQAQIKGTTILSREDQYTS